MEDYIGLDVSMKETSISVRRDGKRVWRGKCASDPKMLADVIRKRAPPETGGVRDRTALGVVLSCSERGRLAGDLHRRPAC